MSVADKCRAEKVAIGAAEPNVRHRRDDTTGGCFNCGSIWTWKSFHSSSHDDPFDKHSCANVSSAQHGWDQGHFAVVDDENTEIVSRLMRDRFKPLTDFPFRSCNSTAKPPSTIKVLLLGGDWLQGSVLRHYVELLGSRPPDWLNHIRFFIVPIGNSAISRYLSSIDNSYATLFGSDGWQQLCSNSESSQSKADAMEITNRIQRYLHSSGPCTQIPIAEAMVNYKEEDSCQIFVPFISVSLNDRFW